MVYRGGELKQCTNEENLHRRLAKIIGQIQAINRMVDEDVLSQINAAESALHKCGQVVLLSTVCAMGSSTGMMEAGGIRKDIALLAISGSVLFISIFHIIPLSFDAAEVAVFLCGIPIIPEAHIGLVTEFDIKADVGITMGGILLGGKTIFYKDRIMEQFLYYYKRFFKLFSDPHLIIS